MAFKDKFNSFFDMSDESEDTTYYDDYGYEREDYSEEDYEVVDRRTNGQNIAKAAQTQGNRAEIRIVEPRVASEVESIADYLLEEKIVIVNFHKTDTDDAKKMINYLNGVTYAVKGKVQRIGEEIFILAPNGIDVDGDELVPLVDFS